MNFRHELLNMLHSAPESRISLAEQLEVTRPYITKLTNALLAEGVIEQTEQLSSGGGRPRTLLAVRKRQYFSLNIMVRELTVEATINDYHTGEMALAAETMTFSAPVTLTLFIETVQGLVIRLCRVAGIEAGRLKHVGIALQGGIEQDTGVVKWCPAFVERDIPLKAQLMLATALSVAVVNIAWCSSYMLAKTGMLKGSWIALMPGLGSLGFGYYINGKPVFGDNGFYPEIVHLPYPGGLEKAFSFNGEPDDQQVSSSIDALLFAIHCTAPVHNIKQVVLTGEFFDDVPADFIPHIVARLASHPSPHINTLQLRYIKTQRFYSMKGLVRLSSDAITPLIG
ncbi:transcriptional regulator [Pantoea sp. AS-PWVM4]|uniref:ROK family protein n=1 Tax=Pantoea sp. AS-PWVM4 TaxID=1332069 RepID=UPI0003AC7F07|nr:ROK family protein [Pantoea sp. AS-PWVM4]ERK09090.1 transcriptional regulator [Pantoea sp. AS-PWVM4]